MSLRSFSVLVRSLVMGVIAHSVSVAAVDVASSAKISGRLIDAKSGAPVAGVRIHVEGPTLASRENSQIYLITKTEGKFEFMVPPGTYDLVTKAGGYKALTQKIMVQAGDKIVRESRLEPEQGSKSYRVETVRLPAQMVPEVSAIDFTPSGTLVVATRRGEIWQQKGNGATWHRFAFGLYEPFGLIAESDRVMYVSQRAEISRVEDLDGDGEFDFVQTLADNWGLTGNYHEFTYGLARDRHGNIYWGNGMASVDGDRYKSLLTRGPLFLNQKVLGETHDPIRSIVRYQGWMHQLSPNGSIIPLAAGFREPIGIGISPQDDLFVTDVSGTWVPTSVLMHVEKGHFYGNPEGLKWDSAYDDKPLDLETLRQMRTPPVVYLPRGPLGTTVGQPVWDLTGGKFGPFGGQIFLGDWTGVIVRVELEKVAGAYQGTAFPFLRGQGLRLGSLHAVFAPDGSYYVGETVRGWIPTGNEGVQRIIFTGVTPVEVQSVHLTTRGFRITFTETMTSAALAVPTNYHITRFQYQYGIQDGSLRMNEANVPVVSAQVRADGREATLELAELLPEFIYEIEFDGLTSQNGEPLGNSTAYYTANRLLIGDGTPVRSALPLRNAISGPPNPVAGEKVFLTSCVACHQVDGRGSKQVGTPDFTSAEGPLQKPDEALTAQIVNGSKIMPSFGTQLPPQDIRNVIAYIRKAFGGPLKSVPVR